MKILGCASSLFLIILLVGLSWEADLNSSLTFELFESDLKSLPIDNFSLPKNAAKITKAILKSYKDGVLAPDLSYPSAMMGSFTTSLSECRGTLNPYFIKQIENVFDIISSDKLNPLTLAGVLGFESVVVEIIKNHPRLVLVNHPESGRNILHYLCIIERFDVFARLFLMASKDSRESYDPDYNSLFASAFLATDKLKRTPLEYALDVGSEAFLNIFSHENLFQFIFEDGSTPILKLIQRKAYGFLKRLMAKYPDILYGSSSYHGNLFHYLLSQERPFTPEMKEFIKLLWQFFPKTMHDKTVFGVSGYDMLLHGSKKSHGSDAFVESFYPETLHLSEFKRDYDSVAGFAKHPLKDEIWGLLKSNISSVSRDQAKRLDLFTPFIGKPLADIDTTMDLLKCVHDGKIMEVFYLLSNYDFRKKQSDALIGIYLHSMSNPPMFRTVIACADNFVLALYPKEMHEHIITDFPAKKAIIGDGNYVSLTSMLVFENHTRSLASLVELHPDVLHHRDDEDRTALMHALLLKNSIAVKILLTVVYPRRFLEYQDINGKTCIQMAIESDCEDCLSYVIAALIRGNHHEFFLFPQGLALIHMAARYGSLKTFKTIIEISSNVSETLSFLSCNEDSVLHLVFYNEKHLSMDYVKFIVDLKPELVDIRNAFYQKPIDIVSILARGSAKMTPFMKYFEDINRSQWQESWANDIAFASQNNKVGKRNQRKLSSSSTTITKKKVTEKTSFPELDPMLLEELQEMEISSKVVPKSKPKSKKKRKQMVKASKDQISCNSEVENEDNAHKEMEIKSVDGMQKGIISDTEGEKVFHEIPEEIPERKGPDHEDDWKIVARKNGHPERNKPLRSDEPRRNRFNRKDHHKNQLKQQERKDSHPIRHRFTKANSLKIDIVSQLTDEKVNIGKNEYTLDSRPEQENPSISSIDDVMLDDLQGRTIRFGSLSAPASPNQPFKHPVSKRLPHSNGASPVKADFENDLTALEEVDLDPSEEMDQDKSSVPRVLFHESQNIREPSDENHCRSIDIDFDLIKDSISSKLHTSFSRESGADLTVDPDHNVIYLAWKEFDESSKPYCLPLNELMKMFVVIFHEVSLFATFQANAHLVARSIGQFLQQSLELNAAYQSLQGVCHFELISRLETYTLHPFQTGRETAKIPIQSVGFIGYRAQLNNIVLWSHLVGQGILDDSSLRTSLYASSSFSLSVEQEKSAAFSSILNAYGRDRSI